MTLFTRSIMALIGLAMVAGHTVARPDNSASVAARGPAQPAVEGPGRATPDVDDPGIYTDDVTLENEIEAAMKRFEDSGLPLVPLRIYAHDAVRACGGAPGVFNADYSGNRIDLCTDNPWVILHELAHAWEHHAMTDATRRTFMDRLGLPTWNDGAYLRRQRAIEVAADIVTWGLLPTPLDEAGQRRHAEYLELYELLTGRQSPRIAQAA